MYPIWETKHSLANPWVGTEDRNDYKDVCDYASGNYRSVLHGVMSNDVDDFEY
jgi:hypothetical protein